jgi:thymidylate synthase ThyX
MQVFAKILADSISKDGIRLRSFEIVAHRFILAEINTHKVLSRNYRSSRAVPVKRLITEVREHPAIPVTWGMNVAGMHTSIIADAETAKKAEEIWRKAANAAADYAQELMDIGIHKQWANRVMEPYMWAKGIITSSDMANFYALRLPPDAQPEFRALAEAMQAAEAKSKPRRMKHGMWHLPYVDLSDKEEFCQIERFVDANPDVDLGSWTTKEERTMELARRMSVARCARVSYRGFDDPNARIEKELELYSKLLTSQPLHASPAEHQATPDYLIGRGKKRRWANRDLHGNLYGWVQYRKTLPGEAVWDYTRHG